MQTFMNLSQFIKHENQLKQILHSEN